MEVPASIIYESPSCSTIYHVEDKVKIGQDLYIFKLRNKSIKTHPHSTGLELSGKSVQVTSLKNNVSRYYTICQCMWTGMYQYLLALESANNDKGFTRKYQSIHDYNQQLSNDLQIVAKVYPQSSKGLSKQLFDAKNDDKFYVTGPFGKGIKTKSGTNMFVVAGTGILPFMDIFACFARQILKMYKPKYSVFTDETSNMFDNNTNFLVYAYYKSESQATGYNFCKLLSDLCYKLGIQEKFTFKYQFSSKNSERLNMKSIVNMIDIKLEKPISKIYVCGTPSINELFEKNLKDVVEISGLDKTDVEIL